MHIDLATTLLVMFISHLFALRVGISDYREKQNTFTANNHNELCWGIATIKIAVSHANMAQTRILERKMFCLKYSVVERVFKSRIVLINVF